MLFSSNILLGTIISISAISWLNAWIGLEINLLSMIPLMKSSKNKFSSESSIKYFMIQTIASNILLINSTLLISFNQTFMPELSSLIISSSLLMKMGAAPFHFWLPEVLSGLEWNPVLLLLTWQKVAPMILLSYCLMKLTFIMFITIMSSLIGSIQGLNQTCMRKILAYSSINHISWMIIAISNSNSIWLIYLLIYSIINLNIVLVLKKSKILFTSQMNKILWLKPIKMFASMNLLSLGGLPPFLGFYPKWVLVEMSVSNSLFLTMVLIIILTIITLYFYIRLIIQNLMIFNSESSSWMTTKTNFFIMNIMFLSLSSLPLIMTIPL